MHYKSHLDARTEGKNGICTIHIYRESRLNRPETVQSFLGSKKPHLLTLVNDCEGRGVMFTGYQEPQFNEDSLLFLWQLVLSKIEVQIY